MNESYIMDCRLSRQCTRGARSMLVGESPTHVLTAEITVRGISEW